MEWTINVMPTLAQEQIDEIEHEMADLIEQLEAETLRADAAERELREFRTRNPGLI